MTESREASPLRLGADSRIASMRARRGLSHCVSRDEQITVKRWLRGGANADL
jgi:hypothetical protein